MIEVHDIKQLAHISNSPYNNTAMRIGLVDIDELRFNEDPVTLLNVIVVEVIGEYPQQHIYYQGRMFKLSPNTKSFYTEDYKFEPKDIDDSIEA